MSEEEDRRRQEINLFAAMALGVLDAAPPPSEQQQDDDDDDAVLLTTNQRAPPHYEEGRQLLPEAPGGEDPRTALASFDRLEPAAPSNLSAESILQQLEARLPSPQSSFDDPTTAAAATAAASSLLPAVGDGSGTFHFAAPPDSLQNTLSSASAAAERSNLEAAAAALSADPLLPGGPSSLSSSLSLLLPSDAADPTAAAASSASSDAVPQTLPAPLVHQHAAPTVVHSAVAAQQQQADDNAPMFAEEVVMPRPLFFGAVVPPRVLREGRQMVLQAMDEMGLERHEAVGLRELPDAVRNLVGALRTYGFGLDDLFRDHDDDHDDDDDLDMTVNSWVGDPFVSTYQPVWGESERADRIKEYQRHMIERPHPIMRSSTAPPRLMAAFVSGHGGGSWDSDSGPSSAVSSSSFGRTGRGSKKDGTSSMTMADSLASANTQFSRWLREEDGESQGSDDDDDNNSEDSIIRKSSSASPERGSDTPEQPLSEQELFSRWARGSDSSRSDKLRQGTFQRLPLSGRDGNDSNADRDSDDDSVNYDEQKKQVGMSDHLSKAIASLSEDDANQLPDIITMEDTKSLLLQTPADLRTRPLTNYELTHGCVPVFGYDDSPLPVDSDLGVHETKEEVQRSNEQKRSQEIIEKLVLPNVFGCIACPNPALNPDDFHSWNSRATSGQRSHFSATPPASDLGTVSSMRRQGGSVDSLGVLQSTTATFNQNKARGPAKGFLSRTRYGWWNIEKTKVEPPRSDGEVEDGSSPSEDKPLVLPPVYHSCSALQVVTSLHPTPKSLHEANLPMSRMHAATSMAQTLPYLSDRPPSHRYLQIDTQAVLFRSIGAEIEPLFCSLAIYNVETVSSDDAHVAAPVPDLQRCGRVTEALNFDIVSDEDVSNRCSESLWPYARATKRDGSAESRLQGTRCGVFPVPSNLSVSNLYAVLIVRKVLSDPGEMDPYLKAGYAPSDLEKLKVRAEKSSKRYGQFLVPFAFGVAPLLQVFGADCPTVASSRAVQIPLFHFLGGERSIMDHIMVMLYPRADHGASGIGGPAKITNGGTAMLVMRNFGYLGLHSVVDRRSSLARDRLVDFTGELQLRARDSSEDSEVEERRGREPYKLRLPDWHPDFVSEPSVHGGRNCVHDDPSRTSSRSHHYAQELAPIPLQLAPSTARVPSSTLKPGGRLHGDDIEPFYHTSFCNELLCHPRLLHHCPKGNIVIKVELREMEWQQEFNAYFAHMPRAGPCIHNNRRGPFLVQSAFTSCSFGEEHHFVDELKVKLPLDLKPRLPDGTTRTLSLLFTVYNVKVGSSSKLQRMKKLLGSIGTGSSDAVEHDGRGKTRLEQVACGFLPLTQHVSLVENGAHDVRIIYSARVPPPEFCTRGVLSPSTLILVEGAGAADSQDSAPFGESFADDINMSTTDSVSDLLTGSETGGRNESLSDLVSLLEDVQAKVKSGSSSEPLSLSVRIVVHSSLHTQSETLSTLLSEELDQPRPFQLPSQAFLSKLKAGRAVLSGVDFHVSVNVHPLESQLLDLVIDVSKHQLCSVPQSSSHLWRIMSLLWRFLVFGTGEPDLIWANPSSPLPLRVHSFATIIHLIGSTSMYLSKNGVTLVDGISGWNVATLGRVVALVFDERKLFGDQAVEVLDEDMWLLGDDANVTSRDDSASERRSFKRRHVRQTYDLFADMPPREGVGTSDIESSQAGTLHSPSPSVRSPHKKKEDLVDGVRTKAPWLDEEKAASAAHPVEAPESKRTVKLDSKSDFQSALRAAASEEDPDGFEGDGGRAARAMIQAFGGSAQGGSKRFLTAPNRALSTIREAADNEDTDDVDCAMVDDESKVTASTFDTNLSDVDSSHDNSVLNAVKKSVKQFRVPNRGKPTLSRDAEVLIGSDSALTSAFRDSTPSTDDEIETAGTAFLDVIGKSLGVREVTIGEDRRVGSQHHRKNHSRGTSIDWSLVSEVAPNHPFNQSPVTAAKKNEGRIEKCDESMSTLKTEEATCLRLPSFSDRLFLLSKNYLKTARWCPYTYEVVIMQWCAILIAQRRSSEKPVGSSGDAYWKRKEGDEVENEVLAHAAVRSIGVAVASAPMLFEVIKQSIGFRILSLFRAAAARNGRRKFPPLVILDETLLLNLEQVISMVTDACLDARNFDSRELRQLSIDVNDSIIRFLRDMFSFLAPSSVTRLMLIYLARFVTKEGKQWQDRDSSIGLRCSWEIAKMRIDAMTSLVRFSDFTRVNSPQMMNWRDWMGSGPRLSPPAFFDAVLEQYDSFRLPAFVGGDDVDRNAILDIPKMRPHWLCELVVDICLLGTVHAEQYIQQRSASLLHEVFWHSAQYGKLKCRTAPIGSMFITFLEKILGNISYLSNFSPKSQLRKDLIPCAIFVLEAAPGNLLRALWRRLICRLAGKRSASIVDQNDSIQLNANKGQGEMSEVNDILDVFSLLNLSLKTMEYEGSEESLDPDSATDGRESVEVWRKEYLLARQLSDRRKWTSPESFHGDHEDTYVSSISRKWEAHDSSLVVVSTAHHIVLEMHSRLSATPEGRTMLNPAVRRNRSVPRGREPDQALNVSTNGHNLNFDDVTHFLRAATSVYLQSLALRQSDIVIVRTFRVTAEAIKIFGIKIFLLAIGETLQHWMRVIFINCGARRAQVRVEATDLLELVLRSTWECFGSFFRIRVPLLAVQTEVMERIVATAAARYYRDQRRLGSTFEKFSHLSAEASLVPLWRTLDRIEKQPASQNVAFRGALVRMAGKLKRLYKAYIAARVLSFIQGSNGEENQAPGDSDLETEALLRARRINVMRVINASQGYSKQFLGFQGTGLLYNTLAHYEAVEDALLDAADIFSATELPEHRVAWLRMLADFHHSRKKFAEEATCHFYIHTTLQQASRLHGSLWSNTPFLPWTDNMPDPVYICDWENPNTDPDYEPEFQFDSSDGNFGRQVESANSFRRIFYRVANSVGVQNDDWDLGGRNLFYGVTSAYEYDTVTPWITLRDMEEQMVEEAEAAAELFLQAGIVQSSRYAWTLATDYYAEKFNFTKLAIAYGNLARTVVTQVPPIDTSLPQEFSAVFGRFYRVWFHGGAPDDLTGLEFVYRTEGETLLDQFGEELRGVIQSIIPDKTPIHLLLDGRPEERVDETGLNLGFSRIGPAPLEPVRIKVTPLRPLSRTASRTRGRPEWFVRYVEEAFADQRHRTRNDLNIRISQRRSGSAQLDSSIDAHHRDHGRTFSASALSSGSSGVQANPQRVGSAHFNHNNRVMRSDPLSLHELAGVDKFSFVQPKDRKRTSKEWWKSQTGDFAEKTLKVTQLQVSQPFPACVTRQEVIHRIVYSQSPLEAGVDAICQWCAILFRSAVAAVGQALIGDSNDPGIGTEAAKVVADCIHSSNVKEMGLALLDKNSGFNEGDSSTDFSLDYDRLTEDEIKRLRVKIARLVIIFIELLHLLIARNRDMLLDIIQERKKSPGQDAPPAPASASSQQGGYSRTMSFGLNENRTPQLLTYSNSLTGREPGRETPTLSLPNGRTREFSAGNQIPPTLLQPPLPSSYPTSIAAASVTAGSQMTVPSPLFESVQQRRSRSASDTGLRLPVGGAAASTGVGPSNGAPAVAAGATQPPRRGRSGDEQSVVSASTRTDSAIAVQSELQRAFISLCKILYPKVQGTLQDETPRWLKQCCQDNYFSLGTYKLTKIPIGEEMCFNASGDNLPPPPGAGASPYFSGTVGGVLPGGVGAGDMGGAAHGGIPGVPSDIDSIMNGGSAAVGSTHSVVSRGSDRGSSNNRMGLEK